MTKDLVLREILEPGIVRITLNDPGSRNAMSDEMAAQFEAVVVKTGSDPELRAVILSGAGQAFSAGGHLEMLLEKTKRTREENISGMLNFYRRFLSIASLAVPVICAVNGHAVGAGLCLALACDLRIAQSGAKFGLNFVHLGLHPGMGATYFLPRLAGPARAAELLYSGRIISAGTALEYGLINQVIDPDKFSSAVLEAARTIAQAGPQAVRELKQSLRRGTETELTEYLQREAACQAEDYSGDQFAEGIKAAMEKRKPSF